MAVGSLEPVVGLGFAAGRFDVRALVVHASLADLACGKQPVALLVENQFLSTRVVGEVDVGVVFTRVGLAHEGVGRRVGEENPVRVVAVVYRLCDLHSHIAGAVKHLPERQAG